MSRRKEFLQVQQLIVKLSKREFDKLPELSGENDMLDALIENLVMLGEELNASTVSKEYFQDIFNSVPDIVLILNYKGEILTGNAAMNNIIKGPTPGKTLKFNDYFKIPLQKNTFSFLRNCVVQGGETIKQKLKLANDTDRTFTCKIDHMHSEHTAVRYLVLLTDISDLENYQSMLIDAATKYRQLFTDSSDGIFLFNLDGIITEQNDAMFSLLKTKPPIKKTVLLSDIISPVHLSREQLQEEIRKKLFLTNIEAGIENSDGATSACLFSCSPIYEKGIHTGYQGMLKNIAKYQEYNAMLMRAMGEFQEKERKRIATDLHDSLGQQLSGIKFMLGTLASMTKDNVQKPLLLQMNNDIFHVIEDLRKICFDLMPGSLEKFGLIKTIEELLSKQRRISPDIFFGFQHSYEKPVAQPIELNIYRVIQEAINNSLKYANCKKINVILTNTGTDVELQVADDGKGLKTKEITNSKGMGLNNIVSRVRSLSGTLTIQSKKNNGTTFIIKIPLNK